MFFSFALLAEDEPDPEPATQSTESSDFGPGAIPDVRDDESELTAQKGNFVVVPIPMSSPTFGTGLILGSAYFYAQTPEQKAAQPASFTAGAAAYTDNQSWAAGVMQQNYWSEDKWRFTGVGGYADFKLTLIGPTEDGGSDLLDWLVRGGFLQTTVSRRMGNGHWFLGGFLRYLDITQDLALNVEDIPGFNPDQKAKALGIGAVLSHDTRDVPTNAYKGHYFQGQASTNDQTVGDRDPYQAYTLRYRTYHQLADSFVLAADAKGCKKHGELPLWDTCRLSLRGFPITEYLSKETFYVQAEARWKFYKRLGVVAFAGAGRVNDSLGGNGEGDTIPSYGLGLRFMVLKSQRINVRVDYARSDQGREAWYLGVMEAF